MSANLSYPQIIIILKIFQDFFACKTALAANHHYPENIQRLLCLQNCLRRKISLSWKYSKTFSPAKLSYLQIILILKKFKDFFPYKIVFDATHHYPENIQKLFACIIVSAAKHPYPEIFKDFCASRIVLFANHPFSESIQGLLRLQNWLRRKSSLSWNNSRILSPAKLSYAQIIIILKLFKDFFACKIVLAANHQNLGNFQRLFRRQNCRSRKSSLSWKSSTIFSPAKKP